MHECNIAEKLVELRRAKGVTQDDVAKSLSVSNKTISKWENGISAPDLPMLVALSQYYGVTTDALLGVAEMKMCGTQKWLHSVFAGLDQEECVLKAFETASAIIPAIFEVFATNRIAGNDGFASVLPPNVSQLGRLQLSSPDFYDLVVPSESANFAVMLLQNKENFAWLKDPEKQKEIVKLFKFLSNEDALSVLYFIHSTACSKSFTADYIAKNTSVAEDRVREILDEFCDIGKCQQVVAHLAEGKVNIYESVGDGLILSLLTLAFDRMCGDQSTYDYNFRGNCKMIGEE